VSKLLKASLVIFDLDGTLIDSAPDIHRAINRMLAQLGGAPLLLPEVRHMMGDGSPALVQRALAACHLQGIDENAALQAFLGFYAEEPTAQTRPYPGVAETLERLRQRGLELALCTNKAASLTHVILERLQLRQYFSPVIGGDSLPYRKPDPRVLLHVLQGAGTAPGGAILVGDSEVDAEAARAVHMPFVLMTLGYHRGPLASIPCDAALEDIRNLPELVAP
jgi:phosphoglycolate phosphatase